MTTDHLSITFAALADPTRRAILARLTQGEATVSELAAPFDLSLPTVSKHLKVLQHAGLVSQSRKAQWRPCRLEAAPLKDVAEWMEDYRQFWEESFTRLDDYLHDLQPAGQGDITVTSKSSTTTFTRPSDREVAMSRVFDAPRELVFQAYTDPKHIPHWWGLRTNTTIVEKMEVRPGGVWRYIQRAPDGTEYAFNGEYREVLPPTRLVSTFEFEGMPGHVVVDTTTFDEVDGKTSVTVTSLFDSIEDRDGMLESGMESGANETWDRLAELLESLKARTS